MKFPFEYFFLLLFPLIVVLPLPLIASSIALAIGLLNVIVITGVRGEWKTASSRWLSNNLLIIFGLLIFVIDTFTHVLRNLDFEFIVREVRISFLLVPIILWLIRDKLNSLKTSLLFSLVIGVLLYIIYAYGYLTYFYSNIITNRNFEFNHYLIYDLRENVPGAYHHSYIGMYMTFAIAILLHYSKDEYEQKFIGLALFILLNQVVFGSKLTLIFSFGLIALYVIIYIKKRLRIAPKVLALISFITLIIGFLIYKSGVINSITFSVTNRIESWQCAFQGFFETPFFGYGHKASVIYLENCITSDAVSAHNQYLEELMNYGLFGLWLPIFFALLFLRSKKDTLFRVLLILIVAVSCFENTLSLQRGVLFFVFFTCIFLLSSRAENPKINF